MRQDSRVDILLQSQEYINQKSLVESISKHDGVLNRYPKDLVNRTFTYIPGNEAYTTDVRKAFLYYHSILITCVKINSNFGDTQWSDTPANSKVSEGPGSVRINIAEKGSAPTARRQDKFQPITISRGRWWDMIVDDTIFQSTS